jgi:thioredoxin reductase
MKLIKNGQIAVHPGIKEFTEEVVIFNDGKQARFEAVILATGYRPRLNAFLTDLSRKVYDENGILLSRGYETNIPVLYFCGYYVAPTGLLREVGIEAKRISSSIAARTNLVSTEADQ